MDTILSLIQHYYGGLLGGAVSLGAIYKAVKNWFNQYVIQNMLVLEKDTTLTNEQKFAKLTSDMYIGLPGIVKLVISQKNFANLSQGIYDKLFPSNKSNNANVNPNPTIKETIASIISDAIDIVNKNTDTKIQEMTKQIEAEKDDQLNKIADTLKQTLGVGNIQQSQQPAPVENQTVQN